MIPFLKNGYKKNMKKKEIIPIKGFYYKNPYTILNMIIIPKIKDSALTTGL